MISIDRLVNALGLTDDPALDEERLEEMRDAAVAFLEKQTGRYFRAIESFEEVLDGTGIRNLWLGHVPAAVDDYTEITVTEAEYPGATLTAIAEGDVDDGFQLRIEGSEAKLVRMGSCGVWKRGYEYTVSYSRGYAENQGPKDIEQLVIDLVALKRNLAGREAMRSESIGGYSYTRFGEGDLDSIDGARSTVDAWSKRVVA